jgi:hypothetical protein
MADIFKQGPADLEDRQFWSFRDVRQLCCDAGIDMGGLGKYEYRRGWAKIVEDLINELKGQPLTLNDVRDEFGELEVTFACDLEHEVKVWRTVNLARVASRFTCAECGEPGTRMTQERGVTVLCQACLRIYRNGGHTGT